MLSVLKSLKDIIIYLNKLYRIKKTIFFHFFLYTNFVENYNNVEFIKNLYYI